MGPRSHVTLPIVPRGVRLRRKETVHRVVGVTAVAGPWVTAGHSYDKTQWSHPVGPLELAPAEARQEVLADERGEPRMLAGPSSLMAKPRQTSNFGVQALSWALADLLEGDRGEAALA